ncbi:hypothetical protein IG631_21112 [Alternaria alternata]|nr:hypothetical protein IG631_21112 [Alternaria alternata]
MTTPVQCEPCCGCHPRDDMGQKRLLRPKADTCRVRVADDAINLWLSVSGRIFNPHIAWWRLLKMLSPSFTAVMPPNLHCAAYTNAWA